MNTIDLSQVESAVLSLLGSIALAFVIAALNYLTTRLHLSATAEQRAEMQEVASKSVAWAISTLDALIRSKGWDHAEVRDGVVAKAIGYAAAQFPDALKRAGINPDSKVLTEQLSGIMERVFPTVAATLAASPATPPVTAATVEVTP
jgi:hypothetical protein